MIPSALLLLLEQPDNENIGFPSFREIMEIGGTAHSVALLALVFTCALVACTSSVLFIPYMNRFRETYLVSYMIGEGLSAFIPSITSLLQGVGGNPVCIRNNATGTLEQYTPPPHFSVSTFLIFIFALQLLSFISFLLLKNLPICKKQRNSQLSYKNNNDNESLGSDMAPGSPEKRRNLTSNGDHGLENAGIESHGLDTLPSSPQATQTKVIFKSFQKSVLILCRNIKSLLLVLQKMNSRTYGIFLIIQASAAALANGLFPAIQSYSCLPYGNIAYHLAINLGSMANPVACYILFFITFTSLSSISVMAFPTLAVAVYIFVTATLSPKPPLVGTQSGEALVVRHVTLSFISC